jgi:hypothetical protein
MVGGYAQDVGVKTFSMFIFLGHKLLTYQNSAFVELSRFFVQVDWTIYTPIANRYE